jgi:hypothetical protein
MGLAPRRMPVCTVSKPVLKSLPRGGRILCQVFIYVITLFVAAFAPTYLLFCLQNIGKHFKDSRIPLVFTNALRIAVYVQVTIKVSIFN